MLILHHSASLLMGFFLPHKRDGVEMEQDFFPTLQSKVGMGLGFLAWLLLNLTLLYWC